MPSIYDFMGWIPELAEPAYKQTIHEFIPFQFQTRPLTKPGLPIWEFAKKVIGGQHIPTWRQETGDCVSMGAVQAGQYLQCYEIAKGYEEEQFKLWFPPYIYGVSRTHRDCGNGQLGRRAGSTGSWAAVAMMKHGVLFADDPNTPQYSGSLADSWGYKGPPEEAYSLARDNPVKSCARLRTVEELRAALINYKPCTIASNRGFKMEPQEYKGYHVFIPQGSWPHQMCYLSWIDDPFPAAYRFNSWGANAHGDPLNGEPPGGAWNRAEDIEKELRSGNVEVYAMSSFEGFKGEADFRILWDGKVIQEPEL